jgi:hypothetical protein
MSKKLAIIALLVLTFVTSKAQVSVVPIVSPHMSFVNAVGQACAGCKLQTFSAGTTTPLATYTDNTGTSQNTNPIILDLTGSANIWFQESAYKLVLSDPLGNLLFTIDNIPVPCTQSACLLLSSTSTQTLAGALAWVGGPTGTPATTTLANLGGVSAGTTAAQTFLGPICQTFAYIDVIACFGAKPDAMNTNDAVMGAGSNVLISATAGFTSADVGKVLAFQLTTGQVVDTTITAVNSATSVTLGASNTGAAITAGTIYFGTDNTAAIQDAVNTANYLPYTGEFDQEIYFSHGYCSTCTGVYLIKGTIQLANSALNLNKRFTFIGDGPGMTRFQEVNPTANMIDITDQGQAGVQNTFENMGFFGVANTQSNFASAINANQTTGIRLINNWFSSWRIAVSNNENTSGTSGGEFYFENNVFEFCWSVLVSPGTSQSPPGQARDITIHGGEIATSNPQPEAVAQYTLDFANTNRVIISDVAFNFGNGQGVRCVGCTSFDMHDNDFSESTLSAIGEEFGEQNLFLQNTTGNIHHNQFHSAFTEAVDIAGGNNLSFSGNTYNVNTPSATNAIVFSSTGNFVTMMGENFIDCTPTCIDVLNTSVSAGTDINNNIFSTSITTPVQVGGGALPSGVNVQLFNGSFNRTVGNFGTVNATTSVNSPLGIFSTSTTTPESIMQSETASSNLFLAGQVTTSSPKEILLENNPASNTFSLDAIQQGVGANQTLQINPSGGPIKLGSESTSFATFLACYTSTGIGHCTTPPTGTPPTCGCTSP